jgi:hypothetical protein
MAHSIAIHSYHRHAHGEISPHPLLWGAAVLSVAILFAVFTTQAIRGHLIESSAPEISVASRTVTSNPPAEWNWKRKGVSTDHMFRSNQPSRSRSSDWIRNSRAMPLQVRTTR